MAHIKYSSALVKRAVRHQVSKALGKRYVVLIAALAATGLITALHGHNDGLALVTASLLLQAFLVPLVVMRVSATSSIARLWTLDSHGVAIDLHLGRLRAHSALGSVDLPLSRITSVTRSEDYWLLHSGRSTLMMLPTTDLPWPTADSWLQELRQACAKVA